MATLARHESGGYKSDKKGDLFVESLFFTALLLKQHYDQTGDYLSLYTAAQYASAAASQRRRNPAGKGNSTATRPRRSCSPSYQAGGSPARPGQRDHPCPGRAMVPGDSDGKPTIEERRFLAELLHARFGRDHQGRTSEKTMKLLLSLPGR